jgi:hypothetical protein
MNSVSSMLALQLKLFEKLTQDETATQDEN